MDNNFLFINNKKLFMKNRNWNFTILQLCEELIISIPRFCYHRELSIVGNCRMCMVELKSSIKPVIACATSLSKNMSVFTNSELVKTARGNVLEFLLINHPLDCPICDQGGECDLQDQAFLYGSDKSRFAEYKRSVEDKNFGPIIKTVMSRCIHCTRCVRYAEEIIGVFSIGTMGRGKETEISTYDNNILHHEMIGNIADICPVGALLIKPTAFRARTWDLQNLDLLDIFDSLVGTASMGVKGNELLRVLPRRNDYLNREWITDRIRFFYEGSKINRLLYPLVTKNNNLLHCSLLFASNLYIHKLYISYQSRYGLIGFMGEELNYYDSFLISHYNNSLNIFCSYADQYHKINSSDLRYQWLLNNDIQLFLNKPNLLFLNVNMKYECVILNSLLYKNINEYENQNIYFIGSFFKNSYSMDHIGISNVSLKNIQKGKHYFCFDLLKKELNWVESSVQPLFDYSLNDYLSSISNYVVNNSYSYIANNSSEVNILELGINNLSDYEDLREKKFSLVHFFGNVNSLDFVLDKSSYKIYFSHHMPKKKIDFFNLFLPILNYYEWFNGAYGPKSRMWLNNQLIGQVLFDHLTTDAGKPNSYYGYLYLFINILSNKCSNNIDEFNLFIENIDNFLEILEISSKYKYVYKKNFYIQNINTSFVNNLICHEVSPRVYYESNSYSRNSLVNISVLNNIFISGNLNLIKIKSNF